MLVLNWIKKLFSSETEEEKISKQILLYEKKSFEAQRKGDMEEAGKWKKKADDLAETLYNKDIGDTHV